LRVNDVRGMLNVGVYALLSVLCHVLNREAAENVDSMIKIYHSALYPLLFFRGKEHTRTVFKISS
jgi:hypothetical protein